MLPRISETKENKLNDADKADTQKYAHKVSSINHGYK